MSVSMPQTVFQQLIDGKLEDSPKSFDVIDPSTGEPFARAPNASREQLDRAVAAARRAQREWAARTPQARREALHAFAASLRAQANEIATVLTREQGKPLADAQREVLGAAALIEGASTIEIEPELLESSRGVQRQVRFRPVGVVGAIAPWNAPIILSSSKVVEALQAGNCMVLKPSPYTPLATLMLGEIAARTLPRGVLNVLSGSDDFGSWMTSHPGIDLVSFTGSCATGKRVAAAAAQGLKRIILELGGNDAAIVLADADVQAITPKLIAAAFENTGQICMAIKRLYVHESLYSELCDALVKHTAKVHVGSGFEPNVTMGPLQNRMQYDRVLELIEDARARGATFLTGGRALQRPGYFVAPTLVTNVAEGVRLVDEEQFGPVLPILPFRDEEDAIARANASRYGLSGSVWTRDLAHGQALAAKLEVGTAWVNKHLAPSPDAPFGGAKESGIGRIGAKFGARAYMEPQVIDAVAL